MADLAPVDNLRAAYHRLNDTVIRALRTHHGGSVAQLAEVRSQVTALRSAADVHRNSFPPEEFVILETSLADMLVALNSAADRSASAPAASASAPTLSVAQRVKTGKRGRPRLEIDPMFLEFALDLRGPTALSRVLDCHPRTVRRRALERGLVPPGAPVRTAVVLPDGSTAYEYTSSSRPVSTMTDAELDAAVAAVLQTFPSFGRKMIQGHFKSQGHNVPKTRIKDAYTRLVNHCFVDGYSRFVLGIRVHNNNRSATVLTLFLECVAKHGIPSRVLALDKHCINRSVHNTRIERLWYDVTRGFGAKWKAFFIELERHHRLDPTLPSHVWLLHHLFLPSINQDAVEWADC
ncbi:hypothetical protein BV20DRAFT_947886 [Pilatotrama ljubarskyi]|nr:hypothetical protein BV20DRAFT_947886 [Pilatotrama ljubarskyi]